MDKLIDAFLGRSAYLKTRCPSGTRWQIAALAAASITAFGQAPAPQTQPGTAPPAAVQTTDPSSATTAPDPTAPANPPANTLASSKPGDPNSAVVKDPLLSAGAFSIQTTGGEIKEDQLKQMLVGKTLYLRAGYQENNLEFDEQGRLLGHSQQGSFTLSQIQVNKVRLSKLKLELEGDRFALHFLGAAAYEDPTKATDRVKITPKKKTVRVSFDREQVETPKKKKEKNKDKRGDEDRKESKSNSTGPHAVGSRAAQETAETSSPQPDAAQPTPDSSNRHSGDTNTTTTTSSAHASQLLLTALDKVFSTGIDDRMVASMPDFWKSYYQAAAQKVDYKPTNPGVFPSAAVDQKAKLVSVLDPPSNEFAQANGVAGIAMYHAVIGSDGKVNEVVAGRPIGFGLDESAEQAIRKAIFQPAVKDGKPVTVALDVVVSFRIYSKRTSEPAAPQEADKRPDQPALPGPYTLQAEEAQARAAQQAISPQPQPGSAQEPPPASTQLQVGPAQQQPSPAQQMPQ